MTGRLKGAARAAWEANADKREQEAREAELLRALCRLIAGQAIGIRPDPADVIAVGRPGGLDMSGYSRGLDEAARGIRQTSVAYDTDLARDRQARARAQANRDRAVQHMSPGAVKSADPWQQFPEHRPDAIRKILGQNWRSPGELDAGDQPAHFYDDLDARQ